MNLLMKEFLYFCIKVGSCFPFFVVNIVTSLLPIKLSTFFWVSMLGMFPATLVYVNAVMSYLK